MKTAIVTAALVLGAGEGSFRKFWVLFGTSNQLLAALTLLGISVWLHRSGRRYWYTLLPMLFVLTITLWSLALQAKDGLARFQTSAAMKANGVVALLLMALAILFVVDGVRVLRGSAGARPA